MASAASSARPKIGMLEQVEDGVARLMQQRADECNDRGVLAPEARQQIGRGNRALAPGDVIVAKDNSPRPLLICRSEPHVVVAV